MQVRRVDDGAPPLGRANEPGGFAGSDPGGFAGSDPFSGFPSEAKSKAPLQILGSHCEGLSIIPKLGFQTEPLLILVQTGPLLILCVNCER
jgi:hypothetical protein